jgi:hypothetical protein
MVRRSIPILVLVTLALCAPMASAQLGALGGGGARPITFGLGGGVAVPVSDARDAFKTGWNGLAYARYQMAGMPVSFGVNVSFHRLDLKDAVVDAAGPGITGGSGSMFAGLGDVKLDLMRGPIRPYALIGVGVYDVTTKLEGTGGGSSSDTRFGVAGGLGVSARVGAIHAFVQGRLDNVFTEKGVVDTQNIQVVPVTAGVEF